MVFEAISVAEKQHESRFNSFAKNIESETVFKKDSSVTWRCRNCGYVKDGNNAPESCPACAHPQAHFEVLANNY